MTLLEKLKNFENIATPAPWKIDFGNWQIEQEETRDGICTFFPSNRDCVDGSENKINPINDAKLIAASRNALPKLIEAVEKMECTLEHITKCYQDAFYQHAYFDAKQNLSEVRKLLG